MNTQYKVKKTAAGVNAAARLLGVSVGHASRVIRGERLSKRLMERLVKAGFVTVKKED